MPHQDIRRGAKPERLTEIEFFTGPAGRVLSRLHDPERAQLLVIVGGLYQAHVDGPEGRQTLRAQAGDAVLWPAGTVRTDESLPGRPMRCINLMFRWTSPAPGLPFVVRDADHVIDTLARRLLALAHDPARHASLGADCDAYLAALLAEYRLLARTAADDLLARVALYTEEHLGRRIRVADLARCVGLEKHHFGRKYKQLTGRTPIQDVLRRKAAHARHLVRRNPGWTLAKVAPLVGLGDSSKLSRLLSRYAGASAREIKRTARRSNL